MLGAGMTCVAATFVFYKQKRTAPFKVLLCILYARHCCTAASSSDAATHIIVLVSDRRQRTSCRGPCSDRRSSWRGSPAPAR